MVNSKFKPLYKLLFAFLLLNSPSAVFSQPLKQRNFLTKALGKQSLETYFENVSHWKKQKREDIFKAVDALPGPLKDSILKAGDRALSYTWPSFKASVFLEFKVNGNRSNFQDDFNERRKFLSQLVMAELVDKKGKYMPQIANGLWLILEESTWVIPAHVTLQKEGAGLPDPDETVIDLTAGETAAQVSYIHLLLKDQLDSVSPMLNKRIHYEMDRKIVQPYLQRNDFWWMGFTDHLLNNWTIWINTNILKAALLTVEDASLRNRLIEKTMRSADQFINYYPEDGGCEEGPSYWGHAGGKLIQFIELLSEASGGRLNWSDNKLIHEIGTYIYKAHIDNSRFVNFADASAQAIPPPANVFAYGKYFSDMNLQRFAAYLNKVQNTGQSKTIGNSLNSDLYTLLWREALENTKPVAPMKEENWLSDLQVITLRSKSGSPKGFFFAAQGGHNGESHNHNDVGNFILYQDGKPVIIDVGVGTYTRQTFSKDRYKLWYMQSQWHNTPTINGMMQKDGFQFKASNMLYKKERGNYRLSMDISKAYEPQAAIKSWQRTFDFNASKNWLVLSEDYQLSEWKEPFLLHFVTQLSVRTVRAGEVELSAPGQRPIIMHFDPQLFTLKLEDRKVDDEKLKKVWGEHLTRVSLESREKILQGKHHIVFSQK